MWAVRRGFRNSAVSIQRRAQYPISRHFSTDEIERDVIEADIIVVGGGPAGLSAAIRAKQYAKAAGKDLEVIIVEKGAEIGAHTLSGNVFEPRAFNELFPYWKKMDNPPPFDSPVKGDKFFYLTKDSAYPLPNALLPSELHNEGNYIVSLGNLCKWMGEQAEELGIDVYSGFAADKANFENGALTSIQLKDTGISKKGEVKDEFSPGPLLKAKQFIIAEGAKGSVTEQIVDALGLEGECPQSYSIGVKEVWKVPKELHEEGLVVHTIGHPLSNEEYGGAFLYHAADQKIYFGLVVGLDYKNPHLSPYKELQTLKLHPSLKPYFSHPESECISYGARALSAGGLQALFKPSFPGGLLVGCSLGTLNMAKIKGTHTAMKSGMIAGETAAKAIINLSTSTDATAVAAAVTSALPLNLPEYDVNLKSSWLYDELYKVRNVKPSFKRSLNPFAAKPATDTDGSLLSQSPSVWGMKGMMAYAGFSLLFTKGREPWTFKWSKRDHQATEPARFHVPPVHYSLPSNLGGVAKPDGKVTFDILENLMRSNTMHEEDQPSHLKVRSGKESIPVSVSLETYGGPEQNFCPAKVYEYRVKPNGDDTKPDDYELVINAQNCVHCKTCAIKTPKEFVKWTVPEGAGGPNYEAM